MLVILGLALGWGWGMLLDHLDVKPFSAKWWEWSVLVWLLWAIFVIWMHS